MSDRPIPFSGEMVNAVLDGRKTQTRRVMKPQPVEKTDPDRWVMRVNSTTTVSHPDGRLAAASARCPYGQPGDRLWVRERQRVIETTNDVSQAIRVRYEADGAESGWIPYPDRLKGEPIVGKCLSYGGYRESSRLTLEVTSVGVERLQDISEEDARAEGMGQFGSGPLAALAGLFAANPKMKRRGFLQGVVAAGLIGLAADGTAKEATYRGGFAHLWNSINAARGYSWESNPFVWVVGFRRVES